METGTGKTYAITTLYLRCLLESKLAVEDLLVVTYTRAATSELRDRIRQRIHECHLAMLAGASKDSTLQALIDSQGDYRIALVVSDQPGVRALDRAEEAFTKLRTISQHENTRLAAVAQRVVDEAVRRARAHGAAT